MFGSFPEIVCKWLHQNFIPFSKIPHTKTTIVLKRNMDVIKTNKIVNIEL